MSTGDFLLLAVEKNFTKANYGSTNRDQTIGKIEDREGPAFCVEKHVIHDVAVDETIGDVADGARDHHREAEMHQAVVEVAS